MATALVPTAPASRYDDPGIVETIRNTVARGANDSQLRMFLEVCKRTGLDPFLKEIWYVAEKNIIMAGRDGYLRAANEHPEFDGMETRVERDSNNIPVKAVCTVWRKDRNHPIVCEAFYSEYKKSVPVWNQYPSAMIAKVAEVLALKRSFSINGVVTQEEIGTEEERGSKAAQQEVLGRKLHEIEARKAAAQAVPADPDNRFYRTAEPVYEAVPEALEIPEPEPGLDHPHDEQLRQSIAAIPAKKLTPKKHPLTREQLDSVKLLKPLHDRYETIGMEARYREILGQHGVSKSTEFATYDDAMRCYKDMSLDVQDMEVYAKREGGDDSAA